MDQTDTKLSAPQYKFTHFRHRPHNTLFGSNLEQISYNQQVKIRALDLEESEKAAERYEAPRIRVKPTLLPPSTEAADIVKQRLMQDYEEKKRRVEECKDRLKLRDERIMELQRQTRYVHPLDSLPAPPAVCKEKTITERTPIRPELIHRHKRQTQGEHTYALIGDLLNPGQDFGMSQPVVVNDSTNCNNHRAVDRGTRSNPIISNQMRQMITDSMPAAEHTIDSSGVKIPANLHHYYGSRVVDQLLSDKDQVNSTLTRLQQEERKHRTRRVEKPVLFVKPTGHEEFPENKSKGINYERIPSPNYEGIGNLMRSNIFGPSSSKHQFTIESQKIHNEAVQQNRDDDMPNQYRYQTDDHKKWVEAHNMQKQVMKEIDQKNMEKAGVTA